MIDKNLGLVSISYRKASAEQIVRLCERHNLMEIEWGGDMHVPHGNIKEAGRIAKLCRDAGISIVSYGAYCDPATFHENGLDFSPLADTALALGAPILRCWCGEQASKRGIRITQQVYDDMVSNSVKMSRECQKKGIKISYEYVYDSVKALFNTQRHMAAQRFLEDAAHENTYSHWQQRGVGEDNLEGLRYLIANNLLTIVHANFHEADATTTPEQSIAKRKNDWPFYRKLLETYDRPYSILVETCTDDDPEHLTIYLEALKKYLLDR